ncbi:hypothetical protein LOD99_6932 [Oopsacas minuta]|uniref:Uncharacterized protein n=1 Tax=Oopsacas minuta TaxID=111878 RepID=A0AAV7JJ44_9METZ|nr:hypothetical protein LOD99_6932 [Oopsacas minuta]
MPSLITKLLPRKSMRSSLYRNSIGGDGVQIDHLHFVEDFRKECFLKQMDLEKNRMQTDLRMDQIRRELSQLHCQSQEFLIDVERLDRDIENERSRRLYHQMYASNDQLYSNDSICSSNPEFSRSYSSSPEKYGSDSNLPRPVTSFSEGNKRSSIESDFESPDEEFNDEYTFRRQIKYRSDRPGRRIHCNLMTMTTVPQNSFSEQVFAAVRDTITTI